MNWTVFKRVIIKGPKDWFGWTGFYRRYAAPKEGNKSLRKMRKKVSLKGTDNVRVPNMKTRKKVLVIKTLDLQ